MLVRQNNPSARTNCVRQSNDFTDLGTLEANSWFIGNRLRAAPMAVGTALTMTERKRLPDWKIQTDRWLRQPRALHAQRIKIEHDASVRPAN